MKRNYQHKATGRKCSLENLESRLAMAGLVSAWVDGNKILHLIGDSQSNRIEIVQQNGIYKVRQTDRDTIVREALTQKRGNEVQLPAFTSIVANLGDGNDSILIGSSFPVFGSIVANLGGGNDSIQIGTRGYSTAINKYASISIDVGTGTDNSVFFGPEVTVAGNLNIKGTGGGGSAVYTNGVVGAATKTVGGRTTIQLDAALHNRISLKGEFGAIDVLTRGGYSVELGGGSAHSVGPLFNNFKARALHLIATGSGNDTLQLFNGEVTDTIYAELGSGITDTVHAAYFRFPKLRQDTFVHTNATNAPLKLNGRVDNYPGTDRFNGFHRDLG